MANARIILDGGFVVKKLIHGKKRKNSRMLGSPFRVYYKIDGKKLEC